MPFILPFAGFDRRTIWLRATLLAATALGLLMSAPVWFNQRVFPLLPISPGFPILPPPLDKVFFGAMLVSLVAACWYYRPAIIFFLSAGLFAFFEDQNRGQPWFYMYWVMLLLTLLPPITALAACRWAVSVAYVWSGIQKLQPAFFNHVPPMIVMPANQNWHLPKELVELCIWAISCAPFLELFIGLALWFARSRKTAIIAAVLVHATALLFLGPLGANYDTVVWPWNVAMMALVVGLFAIPQDARFPRAAKGGDSGKSNKRKELSSATTGKEADGLASTPSFRQTFAEISRSKPALTIIALYSLLPLLSYVGMWDSYFSFTLYSGNQAKADIFISKTFADSLPPGLRPHVHAVKVAYDQRLQGPFVFDFQTWGFNELRVPPIFEPRNYQNIFRYLRSKSSVPNEARMIVGPRVGPMILYQGDSHWMLGSK